MRLWPRKQVYVDDLPRTHDIRFAALLIVLVLALLGGLYAVGFFVAGNRLPRGTTVAGVDVGGMERGEARSKLQDELIPRLDSPIEATALGKKFTIDPQVAGLTFDLEATLSNGLAGERWDPRHMLKVVMGGSDLDAVIDIDHDELNATLEGISDKIERVPVDASVQFAARSAVVSEGTDGVALDYAASADALEGALVSSDETVELPVESLEPDITTAEATDFVDDVATKAMASPIRIRVADVTRTLPPARFARALTAEVDDGELVLGANPAKLKQLSRSVLAALPHHPVNASIAFRDGRPVVVPGRSGVQVAADDWADAVVKAASRSGSKRVASATVTPDAPDFTTQDARSLKIERVVASSDLRVSGGDSAAVRAVVSRLDGALIRPRAQFSFLQRAGAGDSEASSVVASALFDAAFRAGMGAIDRTAPRTLTPGSVAGLDAAVEPGVDLGFTNGTPFGVYVQASVEDNPRGPDFVHVRLWSSTYATVAVTSSGRYNVVEPDVQRQTGAGCQSRPGVAGFEIDVNRAFSGGGGGSRSESVHSKYAAIDGVSCRRR